MNLLLDTHAFLWFMEGNERISQRARAEIEAADGLRALSVASAWEMAIKSSLGKLIGDYANRKHWGHTTLGVLTARRGDVSLAKEQLRESAAVKGDHRRSTYGPSLLLARELCALGEWDGAADYLEACATFWNPEPLRDWVRQLRERQMPEPFEAPDAD
jgi:PIN domain nuclease of toxin-antitoxin system